MSLNYIHPCDFNWPSGLKYVCCDGYIWNGTLNKCIECLEGFYGRNCSHRCPVPTYGEKCHFLCENCSIDVCHHVHGCPPSDLGMQYTTSHSNTSIASTQGQIHEGKREHYMRIIVGLLILAAFLFVIYILLIKYQN